MTTKRRKIQTGQVFTAPRTPGAPNPEISPIFPA
jgi:hypothetical protein